MMSGARSRPGWDRLWRHSYRLGLRWAVREAPRGWRARRVGVTRLVVPLDPWRYYELGRVADARFSGVCLDVSSPKLLPSLLQAEGSGRWTCVDLFEGEIEAWRTIDDALDLHVEDATGLSFADASFDHCICISVIEHLGVGSDVQALAEIWRVLKPGGTLHLTTEVAIEPRDVYVDRELYGPASRRVEGRGVFFEHEYSPTELAALVSGQPWEVETREFAVLRSDRIERWFTGHVPWSYVSGPFLRFVCPRTFETSPDSAVIESAGEGVAYLVLRKPATASA